MQYEDTWSFLRNSNLIQLRYTIVVKNNKVIRVLNYFKLISDTKDKRNGYIIHQSLSQNSEIFQYFSKKYNGKTTEEIKLCFLPQALMITFKKV